MQLFYCYWSIFICYSKLIDCYIKSRLLFYPIIENAITTTPNITRITPVARFNVFGVALLANTAAILAQRNVKITHKIHTDQSGVPPMAK